MGVQVFRQNRWYDHKEWSNSDFKDQNLKWKKKIKRSKLEVTIWHDMYEVHYFILSFSCSWSIEDVGRLDETKKMYYFWERKWEKSGRKKWKNIFSFEDRFRKKTWAGAKLPIKKTAKEVREKSTEMSELLAVS